MRDELNQVFEGSAKPNVFELAVGFSKAATLQVQAPANAFEMGAPRNDGGMS